MGFGKSLFDFIGYMSFFNPIGTGQVSNALEQDDFSSDAQDDCSSDELDDGENSFNDE